MRKPSYYKKLRDEIGKCELCGSKRDLEIHHIIPLALIENNPYADSEDNLLCVCSKCHALLTPRKILTSIGVRKTINELNPERQKIIKFYSRLEKHTRKTKFGEYERLDVATVLDIFDEVFCKNKEEGINDR